MVPKHEHTDACGCAVPTPGADAIDALLARIYGNQEPERYAAPPLELGGDGSLQHISAYRVEEPRPHWHLVGYGLTELVRKVSADPTTSGRGFELTMRVDRGAEEQAPGWALELVQSLASWAVASGRRFVEGQHMNVQGPLSLDEPTELRAVALVRDPVLGRIDTPHGAVEFLQIVGLTLDELDLCRREGTLEVLRAAAEPPFVTDLARKSARASFVEARRAR
jgi:hypothetical protein